MNGNTTMIARIAAFYIIVMGVATFLHALLAPLVYDQPTSGTPLLWDWMNPLNVVALLAMIWLATTGFDGSQRPSMDGKIEPLAIAPTIVLLVYLLNWTAGLSDVDNMFLWVILDTAVFVLGVAIGVRALRATGMEMPAMGMPMGMGGSSDEMADDDDGDAAMEVATTSDDDTAVAAESSDESSDSEAAEEEEK